jgi:hypothetical protein
MSVWQRAKHFEELAGSVAAVDIDAKHFAKHGDADLKADADEKAEENRLRQEIRKEAKLEQPSEQKQDAGQQGHKRSESNVPGAGDRSRAGKTTRKYGRGSRIGGHHEIARRTKDGERDKGKQERVETSDDGRSSNFGVAKRLRNIHGRERKSSQKILRYFRPLKGPQPLEEGKTIHEAR